MPGISDGWITTYLRVGDRIFQTYETDGRGCEVMMPAPSNTIPLR